MRYDEAVANRMKLRNEVKIENRRTGRLPIRSEIVPRIGEKMNCIIEKDVMSIPNAAGPVWKV
jgi:hypothetical protein